MNVLAALHVPAGVQVRAITQGGVSPREDEPLEVQLVTCKRPLMCSAGTTPQRVHRGDAPAQK